MKRLSDLMECGVAAMAIAGSAIEAMVAHGVARATAEDVVVHAMLVAYCGGKLAMANDLAGRFHKTA